MIALRHCLFGIVLENVSTDDQHVIPAWSLLKGMGTGKLHDTLLYLHLAHTIFDMLYRSCHMTSGVHMDRGIHSQDMVR